MIGNFRSPPYIPKEKAEERFDIWRLINEQWMGRNEWSPSGSGAGRELSRPTVVVFRAVAERNHARPRRRFLRARYLNS